MSEGQIAFLGEPSGALEHFARYGLPCPTNYNPADHYIFSLAIRPGDEEACRNRCKVKRTGVGGLWGARNSNKYFMSWVSWDGARALA